MGSGAGRVEVGGLTGTVISLVCVCVCVLVVCDLLAFVMEIARPAWPDNDTTL